MSCGIARDGNSRQQVGCEMSSEEDQQQFRFSLPMLLTLMLGFCFVSIFARRYASAFVFAIPPIVGPFVAYSRVSTWQAAILGLLSAYFWCFALVIPALAPWIAMHYNVPFFTAVLPTLGGSVFGGWVGAEVDRSRLKQRRSRELRAKRAHDANSLDQ